MTKAFVSYVREDSDSVKRIVAVLREFDVEVWLDEDSIKPGLRWTDEIRHGIAHGDLFVACFSKAFEARQKTYMNEELTLAIEELRQRPTNRAWFLPIRLDDCEIPDRSICAGETLRFIQRIDMHTDWTTGMERLLSVLAPGSEHIPRLLAQLDHESARRRVEAIEGLGSIGPFAARTIPRLLEQIDLELGKGPSSCTILAALKDTLIKMGYNDPQRFERIDRTIAQSQAIDFLVKRTLDSVNSRKRPDGG